MERMKHTFGKDLAGDAGKLVRKSIQKIFQLSSQLSSGIV